jgi:hypothetical protein
MVAALQGGEAALDVRLEIGDVFETDGNAQEVRVDSGARAFRRGDAAVGGGRRMSDRRLDVAEIRGDRQQPRGVDEAPGSGLITGNFKRDDAAEGRLLPARQRVLGMGRKARVVDARDAALVFEPAGDGERRCLVRVHA